MPPAAPWSRRDSARGPSRSFLALPALMTTLAARRLRIANLLGLNAGLCLLRGARPLAALADEPRQLRAARPAAGEDVAGERLHLLDVNVRVEDDRREIVGRASGRETAGSPVVRQADLVDPLAVEVQRPDAVGDEDARLDRRAGGDDGGPAPIDQVALLGEVRVDLDEHRRLELGEIRHGPAEAARRVVLADPVGRQDERIVLGPALAGSGVVRVLPVEVILEELLAAWVGSLRVEEVV